MTKDELLSKFESHKKNQQTKSKPRGVVRDGGEKNFSKTEERIVGLNQSYDYMVRVWAEQEGYPPNDVDYPNAMWYKWVIQTYNGLPSVTPMQIFNDMTGFFTEIVEMEIVNKEGDGWDWER